MLHRRQIVRGEQFYHTWKVIKHTVENIRSPSLTFTLCWYFSAVYFKRCNLNDVFKKLPNIVFDYMYYFEGQLIQGNGDFVDK